MKNQASKKPDKWTEVSRVFDNFPKCDHYFEFRDDGCKCTKCNMGLIGVYELENGKPIV